MVPPSNDTMTCERAVGLVMDFLEGGLSPKIRESLQAHLDRCEACRRLVDSYRETSRLCREAWRLTPAPAFSERLVRFLKTRLAPEEAGEP